MGHRFMWYFWTSYLNVWLTHWCRVTHICVDKLTIIGSDMACRLDSTKPLSEPVLEYCQLETNFSEISIGIQTFSFKKVHLKMSTWWRPFCIGLKVLMILCAILQVHVVHVGLGTARSVWAPSWKGNVLLKKTRYLDHDINVSKVKWISRYCMAVTSAVTFLCFSNFVTFSYIDISVQWKEL